MHFLKWILPISLIFVLLIPNNDIETVEWELTEPMFIIDTGEVEPIIYDLGEFKITAYCPCTKCCGQWTNGITSTGVTAQANRTIAVDPKVIPYGSKVLIDGKEYVAEDCGGAIKGNRIDVFFDTHQEALQWGIKYKGVSLIVE